MRRNHFNRGKLLAALVPLVIAGCSDTIPPWLLDDAWGTDDPSRLSTTDAIDASNLRDSARETDVPTSNDTAVTGDATDISYSKPDNGSGDPADTAVEKSCVSPPCRDEGVCAHSNIIITNLEGTIQFTYTSEYYEKDEKSCDGLDNDCDGETDEGLLGQLCRPRDCEPNCAGRECGSDACGSTCGECTGNLVCGGAGMCECPTGFTGPDCGACEPGYTGYPDCHMDAVQVSAGFHRTCVLLRDGRTKCWGDGSWGAFGDGTDLSRMEPKYIELSRDVLDLSVKGYNSGCALMKDSSVECWGAISKTWQELTREEILLYDKPTKVADGATSVATGAIHACIAFNDGTVSCWGTWEFGWMGFENDPEKSYKATPYQVEGIAGVTALAAGYGFTCAVRIDGSVLCWGSNTYGERGTTASSCALPEDPVSGLDGFVTKITAGSHHACALTADGQVWCWGMSEYGACGIYQPGTSLGLPAVQIQGIDGKAVDVSAGHHHTCAVLQDGRVVCWGENMDGELGVEIAEHWMTDKPLEVVGLAGPATSVSAGYLHTCALLRDGRVQCWGDDRGGELGRGAPHNSRIPAATWNLGGPVTKLALGSWHTCALTEDGSAKCWGSYERGRLGHTIEDYSALPTPMSSGPVNVTGLVYRAVDIDAGWGHTCVLTLGGYLYCWGDSIQGQAGTGTYGGEAGVFTATKVEYLDGEVKSISAAGKNTCAVMNSGEAWCWGWDSFKPGGEAGPVALPFKIPSADKLVQISGDNFRQCSLDLDGSVFCWSRATPADVVAARTPPVEMTGGADYISSGEGFACALTTHRTVECWGTNENGQLGDGTTTSRDYAVPVAGLGRNVIQIACGDHHACALMDSGIVKCWGQNDFGQVGDGSLVSKPYPVWISGLGWSVKSIHAGPQQTCAVLLDGSARCWGDDRFDNLGNEGVSFSASPADVMN